MATMTDTADVVDTDDPFLTSAQLEAWTGIPASTWRFWAQKGTGPKPAKLGGRWFWRRSVVAAYIREAEAAN